MLVLTRRCRESVEIYHRDEQGAETLVATVRLLGVKGSQVRLGFDAADNVAFHREEVARRFEGKGLSYFDKHKIA